MALSFGPRRNVYVDIAQEIAGGATPLAQCDDAAREKFDLIYRSLCAMLYNYVPMSGHPGGSISSGRFVAGLLFETMDYDVADPDRPDADIISYAAGHKALGLYAMWALRNEVMRIGAPELLPADERRQLRLEDMLGFRRNPVTATPQFRRHRAKALDGHPTPATPFVKLSTGASGVGLASSLGLALAAKDYWGEAAPRVHIVEGEGGLTPGRSAEALAAAGSARLDNAVLHIDWNQSSIDSDRVCREGENPGDYVQWDPAELAYLHDWNVVHVPDGFDLGQIAAAQARALAMENGQPTAVVYRCEKGWRYGITGRAAHGAGHKLCSEGFHEALAPLIGSRQIDLPRCCAQDPRCAAPEGEAVAEDCFWTSLSFLRQVMEDESDMVAKLADDLRATRERLELSARKPRRGAPQVEHVFDTAAQAGPATPPELMLTGGSAMTLRGVLGNVLNYYNRVSGGAILVSAADLLGSTSVDKAGAGFADGFYNAVANPDSRIVAAGGICEDALAGLMSGVSAYGRQIGVASSYAAFIAPLGHVSARLHAIGCQARREFAPAEAARTMFLVCAHAGLKTGEDGPTHADPQALQLLQGNFPPGAMVTLTPWDPREIWPLVSEALVARPAVIAPFVTRPSEALLDREILGLAPAAAAVKGLYRLRAAKGQPDGTIVLQGSGVAYAFIQEALPRLEADGIDLEVYYVASEELFDRLPRSERETIFPAERAAEAMGITGFTLPTLYRWVTSARGRSASLHPFKGGRFLGSGQADKVMAQAGLDGRSQFEAVRDFVEQRVAR